MQTSVCAVMGFCEESYRRKELGPNSIRARVSEIVVDLTAKTPLHRLHYTHHTLSAHLWCSL